MISRTSFLFILFFSSQSFAGAWLQEKGRGININTGRMSQTKTSSSFEFNPYVEWGITDEVTLSANGGVQKRRDAGVQGEVQTAYGEIASRFGLSHGKYGVLSLQGMLGAASTSVGEMRLLWGVSPWSSLYFNTEVGVLSHFGQRPSEWRIEESAGWKHSGDRILLGQIFWIQPWKSADLSIENDSLEGRLSYVVPVFKAWSVQGGVSHFFVGTPQMTAGLSYFSGVWYRW